MADCTESKEDTNAPRLPAVMELDAVDESSENSANDDLEDQSCEENSRPKVMFLRKYFDGSNSGSTIMQNSTISPSILRPSKLGGFSLNSSNSTTLPSTSGPLETNNEKKTNQNDSDENNEDIDNDNDKNTKNDEKNNKDDDENNKSNKNSDDEKVTPLKFLPLLSNVKEHDNNTSNSMTSKTSVSGFVFGQNFNERATVAKNDKNDDDNNDSDVKKNSDDADDNNIIKNNIIDNDKVVDNDDDDNNDADGADGSSSGGAGGGNGAGDDDKNKDKDENNDEKKVNENGGLFSTAATALRTTSRPGITLSQAAQEVEEANRANKRKYNEVALKTGEEDEINVLQINNAKLFTFDKETKGWKERGRGPLRLNDRDEESRLIGRISGTQRLMLNTKIWPGMTAELPGPKSLRITAMDIPDDKVSGDIRIFLVQAAPKEVDELHELLIERIERAKERQPKKIATSV